MTYFKKMLTELVSIMVNHRPEYAAHHKLPVGSKRFHEIEREVTLKMGPREWDRMLHKAKVLTVKEKKELKGK